MLRTPFANGYTKFLTVRTYTRPNRRLLSCLVLLVIALLMICIAQLVIILSGSSCSPNYTPGAASVHESSTWSCGPQWIWFNGKCYYFSEEVKNWTLSQEFCMNNGSDLTKANNNSGELTFLKRYKGPSDHWIGLKKTKENWTWVDGTPHNNESDPVKNLGECAYINDNGLTSARCYTERKWICKK
ncbi:protein vECTL [Elephant endotheliotropic herpesvirus 3A]|uniref:Protein vECTL n=1 Tax=Elephant endotheliotropic herpesvirus 3A TaxID=1329409 RepID=A0A866VSM9_9BETA|nr:protein vECTL [Elephant endotheliotropic herpesvirus 3A]QOE74384.1 protein vECTL [Elephant endotheliotropic herpesvirus 3A]